MAPGLLWQGSRVTEGGGEARERPSVEETGSLKGVAGVSLGTAKEAGQQPISKGLGCLIQSKRGPELLGTRGDFHLAVTCTKRRGTITQTEQRINTRKVIRRGKNEIMKKAMERKKKER